MTPFQAIRPLLKLLGALLGLAAGLLALLALQASAQTNTPAALPPFPSFAAANIPAETNVPVTYPRFVEWDQVTNGVSPTFYWLSINGVVTNVAQPHVPVALVAGTNTVSLMVSNVLGSTQDSLIYLITPKQGVTVRPAVKTNSGPLVAIASFPTNVIQSTNLNLFIGYGAIVRATNWVEEGSVP